MRKITAAAAGVAAIITSAGTAGAASAGQAGTTVARAGQHKAAGLTAASGRRVWASAPRPGSQLWVKRYRSPGKAADYAHGMAVSPDGKTVYVTGSTAGSRHPYTTVAYRAATGAQRWISHENVPGSSSGAAAAIAAGPGGRKVYVTGDITSAETKTIGTVAYNAVTGARLWRSLSPGGNATSLAVSPDGTRVFVAGNDEHGGNTTTAYDAGTGAQLWAGTYTPSPGSSGIAYSVAVSPDGKTVYVTGANAGPTRDDYTTIAYSVADGTRLWASTYDGSGHLYDDASSLAVSPDGAKVFVTGTSRAPSSPSEIADDYATIAYDAKTGAQLWVRRYNSPGNGEDTAYSLAVSPDGKAVYVTGSGGNPGLWNAYTTIAYRTATGARLWIRRYSVSKFRTAVAYSLAVGPDGKKVFVTGASQGRHSRDDYATVAYRASNGAQLWVRRYNGPANADDGAVSAVVSLTTRKVFVTGTSMGTTSGNDFLTIAYHR